MSPYIIGEWPAGSPEWHEARRFRIGGSEIGTVAGFNKWQTRDELLAEKLGHTERRSTSEAMERGNYCERAVIDWFTGTRGVTVHPNSKATFVDGAHDWALFNPDAMLSDGTLLEAKTAKEKTADHGWGRAGTDQVPLPYAAQVQWGMHILGLKVAHIAVLFGNPFGFRAYHLKYDRTIAAYLLDQAATFHAELTDPHNQRTEAA